MLVAAACCIVRCIVLLLLFGKEGESAPVPALVELSSQLGVLF